LLGYSSGGYAILLALGDENFRRILAGSNRDGTPGPFNIISTVFLHFLVMQVIALIYALLAEASFSGNWGFIFTALAGAVGYFFFLYSVCLSLAAMFGIYRLARWYDQSVDQRNRNSATP
jgi:hypothetical protein